MDDHNEGREPAAGDPAEQSEQSGQSEQGEPAEQDATDNPLARIDPDSDVVAAAAAAKGGVNDPADDPLWNPALEPQDPQARKSPKKQEEQEPKES